MARKPVTPRPAAAAAAAAVNGIEASMKNSRSPKPLSPPLSKKPPSPQTLKLRLRQQQVRQLIQPTLAQKLARPLNHDSPLL